MGNQNSSLLIERDPTGLVSLPHFTFVIPIFGHPSHANAFILGARSANTVHNLFGDFILAPWFENVSSKMSNERIFDVFGGPERPPQEWVPDPALEQVLYPNCPHTKVFALKDPLKNHSYRCDPSEYEDSGCDDDNNDDNDSRVKGKSKYPTIPIIINDQDCDDPNPLILPWAAHRIELDTSTIPTLRPQPVENRKSGNEPNQAHHPTPPASIPFLKIASLSQTNYFPHYSGQAMFWHPDKMIFHDDDENYLVKMRDRIFPLRGISPGKYWNPKPYVFENQKPFMGTGGDGQKTEQDIFSGHIYPRTSLFRVEPTVGYDFQRVSKIPHISDVPMKHLATILILDVASDTALLTLYHFIRETITLLTKGSILALTDVNLYIISLNADRIDSRVISDDEIINQLSQIGFSHDRIHFTPFKPSRYFTRHLPVIKQRPTWQFEIRSLLKMGFHPDKPPKITPPLLTRRDLKRFSAPLWNEVYTNLFHLYNTGYWSRLHQTQFESRLVPPSQYPLLFYHELMFRNAAGTVHGFPLRMFEKALKNFLKNSTKFPDEDILVHIKRVLSIAFYKWIRWKIHKMFEPIAIELEKPQLSQSKQGDSRLSAKSKSTESDQFYEDLYGTTSPDWDDAGSYFVHPFDHLENPLPVPFLINFVPGTHNSAVPLPLQYQHQYTQRLGLVDGVCENSGGSPFVTSALDKSPPQLTDEGNSVAKNGYCFQRSLPPKLSSARTPIATTTTTPSVTSHNSIQSRLGLPSNYEFESFLLWGTDALVSDPTGLMTPSYFPQPHFQKVKNKEEAAQAVRQEGFKRIQARLDDQQPILLTTKTNLTSVYFSQTGPKKTFRDQKWDKHACFQLIELFKFIVVRLAVKFHWGAFYSESDPGSYSDKSPAVPPTLLKIRPNAIPLTYCSSRATWEIENCFGKFGKKMGAVVVGTAAGSQREQGNNQPQQQEPEDQKTSQQSIINLPLSQFQDGDPNPLKIKMTYFYQGADSPSTAFPNSPRYLYSHSGQSFLTDCPYYSHPLATSTPFAPLTWCHGVVVIPFLYVKHRTQRFLELLLADQKTKLRDPGPGFMEPFQNDDLDHQQTATPYPDNFIPPPIPALDDIVYRQCDPENVRFDNSFFNPFSCGPNSRSSDPTLFSSSSFAQYHCPINWVILIMNPVEPDPVPYCELEPTPVLRDALKQTALQTIGFPPGFNPFSPAPTTITHNDHPILVEPITASQHRYFTEVLPALYKRKLVDNIFAQFGLITAEKLEKLWNVHLCQPETLALTVQQCEDTALMTRLKLYHDFALKRDIHRDSQ